MRNKLFSCLFHTSDEYVEYTLNSEIHKISFHFYQSIRSCFLTSPRTRSAERTDAVQIRTLTTCLFSHECMQATARPFLLFSLFKVKNKKCYKTYYTKDLRHSKTFFCAYYFRVNVKQNHLPTNQKESVKYTIRSNRRVWLFLSSKSLFQLDIKCPKIFFCIRSHTGNKKGRGEVSFEPCGQNCLCGFERRKSVFE